jgi:tetratricopeptide (TPR) repeat protein
MGLFYKFRNLLKGGNSNGKLPKEYLDLVQKEPNNANAHLKLAALYQKKGEKQKALSEFLLAADILTEKQSYDHAIAIYKRLYRQDPSLDQVHLKIANIYREKGFLADAVAHYRVLEQFYESLGMKDEASEIMKLITATEVRETPLKESSNNLLPLREAGEAGRSFAEGTSNGFFDLGAELRIDKPVPLKPSQEVSTSERIHGVKEIFKKLKEIGGPSVVDPYFNYTMGLAYRKLGFCDEAIEQFEIAVKERQKPFEALTMLGFCYKEKDMPNESQRFFEKALRIDGTAPEKILNVKHILSFLYQEKGRIEEAKKLLQEIAAVDKWYRNAQDEVVELQASLDPGRKSSRR